MILRLWRLLNSSDQPFPPVEHVVQIVGKTEYEMASRDEVVVDGREVRCAFKPRVWR